MPPPLLVCFTAGSGSEGAWAVESVSAVKGDSLPFAECLTLLEGPAAAAAESDGAVWSLKGVVSSLKYATREELTAMSAKGQPPLSRPTADRAALIPIRKTPSWWALAQDERRAIMTAGGHITPMGTAALPAVARRLHHCRELGTPEEQPFDFLTWFEYSAADEPVFDELLARLRATPEWVEYVDREVEVRLKRL